MAALKFISEFRDFAALGQYDLPDDAWKLSPIDLTPLNQWGDYAKAKEAMHFFTDTADSPWTVIKSDNKKRARLNALRYVLHKLSYSNKNIAQIWPLAPLLEDRAHVVYERGKRHVNALIR